MRSEYADLIVVIEIFIGARERFGLNTSQQNN